MNSVFDADRRLYLLLHSRLRTTWLDPIMIWATKAGTKGVLWIGLATGLFIDGSAHARWASLLAVAALLVAEGAINLLLKPLVRRERPHAVGLARLLVAAPGPHSWPSAHAGSAIAAAGVLAVAYPLWAAAFLVLALLIAYSRIYVGVHYPLDVLSGLAVGVLSTGIILLASRLITPLLPFPTNF